MSFLLLQDVRVGGREVECAGLEIQYTCKRIVGSNPTLPANPILCIKRKKPPLAVAFLLIDFKDLNLKVFIALVILYLSP